MPRARRATILTTLLFTDIVGSTKVAEEMGDRRWRELLARHHRIIREALRDFGGRELDTAGDGVFARFDSPGSAIRGAASIGDAVRELGIEIRAGVHIGECEVFDGKLSGVNVHVGARTMSEAGAGQILVTGSLRDMVRGAGFGFADRGLRELRGTAGKWHLFEVTSIDNVPRDSPLSEEEARSRRDVIVPPPLVKRRRVRLTGVVVAGAILVTGASIGIGRAVGPDALDAPLTGCEVTEFRPLNDRAFNQAVFDGLTDAATKWGISVRDKVSQAPTPDEWTRHIRDFVKQKCGLIVTVGGHMANTTAAAAKRNPKQRFLITDASPAQGGDNVLSVVFRTDQAAFQAGYLAAQMTTTGKVATFGGIPIATVITFMNGFAAGILYYNRLHKRNVELLGWDPRTQEGTFVSRNPGDFGVFSDRRAALRITADLISLGADIVMPVDGTAGEDGAGGAVRLVGRGLLIGVDTDQFFSKPRYADLWLTSVLKRYRRMVYLAMGDVVEGDFKGGVLSGTLANDGVGLAPFHGLESRVPRSVQGKLREIRSGIVDGSISVDPATYLGT
jgi:basic membrane protein A and related proteins